MICEVWFRVVNKSNTQSIPSLYSHPSIVTIWRDERLFICTHNRTFLGLADLFHVVSCIHSNVYCSVSVWQTLNPFCYTLCCACVLDIWWIKKPQSPSVRILPVQGCYFIHACIFIFVGSGYFAKNVCFQLKPTLTFVPLNSCVTERTEYVSGTYF
jgi:hypothetical protein